MLEASTEPDTVAMLAAIRHAAQRPSGASCGTGFSQRGHCRACRDCCEFSVVIPGIERTVCERYATLRVEGAQEVSNFVVYLGRVGNGLGDLLPQPLLEL